jgi:hypothetical protein
MFDENTRAAAERLLDLTVALLPTSAAAIGRGEKPMVAIEISGERVCTFEMDEFLRDVFLVANAVAEKK